jgi:hypothetical protein
MIIYCALVVLLILAERTQFLARLLAARERLVFDTYRQLYPVSSNTLRVANCQALSLSV